jgi:hypothetical protein
MRTLAYYLAKIPPEHATDANFMAEVALVMQPFVDARGVIGSLPAQFDLDYAIGVQLDATGAWIGQSRQIPVPVLNPWFSFDTTGLGFDQGYWFGPFEGVGLSALDDTTYRRLLRACVLTNNSNGTQVQTQAALNEYFIATGTHVFVIDETDFPSGNWSVMNLSMTLGVSGNLPTIVDLSVLEQVLAPRIQGAGVGIDWAVTTSSGAPVFGFDVENQFISGFDVGAWGASPDFVINNIIL